MASEYSGASRQLSPKMQCFLDRPAYAPSSVLEAHSFIIIFLNKVAQRQCKHCLNRSIWLMEIKPKGK